MPSRTAAMRYSSSGRPDSGLAKKRQLSAPSTGTQVGALKCSCSTFSRRSASTEMLTTANTSNSSSDVVLRSEEHTSELQSRENLVCRLLLEKKKERKIYN